MTDLARKVAAFAEKDAVLAISSAPRARAGRNIAAVVAALRKAGLAAAVSASLAACAGGPGGNPYSGVDNRTYGWNGGAWQQPQPSRSGEAWGTVGGTLLGAGLGAWGANNLGHGNKGWQTFGGAVAGGLVGGLLGNAIGSSVDRADAANAQRAQVQAMRAPLYQAVPWQGRNAYGTFTPTGEGFSPDGRLCRQFEVTVTMGGQQQTGVGTACQQPDGTWRVMSGLGRELGDSPEERAVAEALDASRAAGPRPA
jgi:surface antigen